MQGLTLCCATAALDSFCLLDKTAGAYTWWDYRMAAFRRNMGLRIDHVLVSPALAASCMAWEVDKTPRKLERPSDHAPVLVTFNTNEEVSPLFADKRSTAP